MNPQGPDLLSQLRDIHGAPQASWWPPAPGWWFLTLILAVLVFFFVRRALENYRVRQRRLALTRYIDRVALEVDPSKSPQQFLSSLNRVFKIVALRAFPGNHCALMQGDEWAHFLRDKLADPTGDELNALARGPYQPAPDFDAGSLTRLARQWVARFG